MQTVLLNNGEIVVIGSQYDALDIISEYLSPEIANYLIKEIAKMKEDEKLAVEELNDCSKIYKKVMKLNNELSDENNKMRCEIAELKSELYHYRKSTQ